ncbi:alpha/beta hydrolase [Desulfosarcina alkanivorans]|uniref:Alpha/beta hydrolase n=1 Tax=Desulfosarcina alkanivorans TaxID=571177 RepID=A0A5K7YIR4_9BACT|nr:alpha/beta hydrolase [Desulfosarcina alkanivorans]BBO66641.1 alpha/beta hydrolase [Desulfosarcina alkanivorans]
MTGLGWEENKRIGIYGNKGPTAIVLHGGPGASGSAAPVAIGLSYHFRVLEPWQRRSSDIPLTVAVHISDIYDLIKSCCSDEKPILVGESWGAMLALAYAAEYPETVGPIALIGCGTFDKKARAEGIKIRQNRIKDYIKNHPEHRSDLKLSISEQIMKWHEMTDSYELDPIKTEYPLTEPFDMKAHTETWSDMLRSQDEGKYPQAFTSIKSPVIMLHGAYDPHPGKLIRNNLRQYIPQLEYFEFEKCGHAPSVEKYAKDDFFKVMQNWLMNMPE